MAPSKSPNTEEEAGVSNEVSAGASALSSLCSAYASDSEDNEEMSGILITAKVQSHVENPVNVSSVSSLSRGSEAMLKHFGCLEKWLHEVHVQNGLNLQSGTLFPLIVEVSIFSLHVFPRLSLKKLKKKPCLIAG